MKITEFFTPDSSNCLNIHKDKPSFLNKIFSSKSPPSLIKIHATTSPPQNNKDLFDAIIPLPGIPTIDARVTDENITLLLGMMKGSYAYIRDGKDLYACYVNHEGKMCQEKVTLQENHPSFPGLKSLREPVCIEHIPEHIEEIKTIHARWVAANHPDTIKFSKKDTRLNSSYIVHQGVVLRQISGQEKNLGKGQEKLAFRLEDPLGRKEQWIRTRMKDPSRLDQDAWSRNAQLVTDFGHEEGFLVDQMHEYNAAKTQTPRLISIQRNGGISLHEFIQTPRDPQIISLILCKIAERIQTMHEKGWIHGDIKPQNILVRFDPENIKNTKVYLIDFGQSDKENNGEIIRFYQGTPKYMAPEIKKLQKEPQEFPHISLSLEEAQKTDVYSFGVLAQKCYQNPPNEPLYSIIISCTKENHTERPSIQEYLQKMQPLSQY